jgi:hypothetical protein
LSRAGVGTRFRRRDLLLSQKVATTSGGTVDDS